MGKEFSECTFLGLTNVLFLFVVKRSHEYIFLLELFFSPV